MTTFIAIVLYFGAVIGCIIVVAIPFIVMGVKLFTRLGLFNKSEVRQAHAKPVLSKPSDPWTDDVIFDFSYDKQSIQQTSNRIPHKH